MKTNPRFDAFLKLNETKTWKSNTSRNYEYIGFISDMVEKYAKSKGQVYNILNFRVQDHDDFTRFILNYVEKEIDTKTNAE